VSAETVDVLIVGAGFAGLGMAIQLRKAGMGSFLIVEKGGEVGGTWWYNRYPGCACDIPSHLYSFSFERNPDWSRMYAGQAEILEYLKACAKRYGVAGRVRLNTPLREARWDEARGVWRAIVGSGSVIEARVLVSGMGALHVPRFPELKGMERFRGSAFHSAEWNAGAALAGRRVAVIGTGASAIQIVPAIAGEVGKLSLFQRTPAWVLPRFDHPISDGARRWFRRVPALSWLLRSFLFWNLEMRVGGFVKGGWLRRLGAKMARRHLEAQVPDARLRAALTPQYEFGCKRVLISSDFYPALARPNVELVTAGIEEIREHSIVTAGGVEHPVDAIVYSTGFRVTEMLGGIPIYGRHGAELHEVWGDRIGAYLGIAVSRFPNFFMLLGPNTGLGHNSVVLMIEAQVQYVMSCLKLMRKRGASAIDLKPERLQSFLEEMRARLPGTVWESGGCKSWYQDSRTGETPAVWPGSVVEYQRRTRSASAADYVFTEAGKREFSHR
jgi:cation diffusion facilitator CzcD-associated flavoprotein CzcO